MTRRDKCHAVGVRASLLTTEEAAQAWFFLSGRLEGMGDMDIPKFHDLLTSIRRATIYARRLPPEIHPKLQEEEDIAAQLEG